MVSVGGFTNYRPCKVLYVFFKVRRVLFTSTTSGLEFSIYFPFYIIYVNSLNQNYLERFTSTICMISYLCKTKETRF